MRYLLLIIFCLGLYTHSFAQKRKNKHNQTDKNPTITKELVYQDATYEPTVKTVQLYSGEEQLSYPILLLDQIVPLSLEFDILNGVGENLFITIVHCTQDWQNSNLNTTEYLTGLNDDVITDFKNSLSTLTPYMHYHYVFPNANMGVKLSGNYLLKVYRNQDQDDLLLTKRFFVSDQTVFLTGTVNIATDAALRSKSHQIDMSVGYNKIAKKVQIPITDIKVKIMQNNRWDRVIENPRPTIIQNNTFTYDGFAANITFDAINEFRRADARSVTQYSNQIRKVFQQDSMFYAVLFTDTPRSQQRFFTFIDFNGQFYVDNLSRRGIKTLIAEYQKMCFSLNMAQIPDGDVYVIGAFSDWQLKPECKMEYDDITQVYQTKVLLKQGIYDYLYVFKPKDAQKPVDHTIIENSYSECQNTYTVLVYYRPFGGRSDCLAAIQTFRFGR